MWAQWRVAFALLACVAVLPLAGCSQEAARASRPEPAATHTRPPAPDPVSWTWSPHAPRSFVPQGLVRVDDRLFITGYHWTGGPGGGPCQVLVLDATDGSRIAHVPGMVDPTSGAVCHHGGGAAYSRAGLWVAGSGRLWLVDPDDPGRVRRTWSLDPAVRASTITVHGGRLWVARFSMYGGGRLADVALRDLLRPGVTGLARADGPGLVRAHVRHAPNFVQGIAIDERGLWLSRSSTRCGDLVGPRGGHRRLIPGAEGMILVRPHHAWVLSESGSPHYQSLGGRPDVPTLSYVDLRKLSRGRCFRA